MSLSPITCAFGVPTGSRVIPCNPLQYKRMGERTYADYIKTCHSYTEPMAYSTAANSILPGIFRKRAILPYGYF